MTEIEDMVNSFTSNLFSTGEVTTSILTASKFAGIKEGRIIPIDGTDDQDNLGVSMFAVNILLNSLAVGKSKAGDSSVVILTMEKMYTDEIKDILEVGDVKSPKLVRVTSINPTEDWEA